MSEEVVDLSTVELPQIIRRNTKIGGLTWLAGAGPRHDVDVMIVTNVVSEEEAAEEVQVGYEKYIKRTPRMLDCPQGVVLKDLAIREGIDLEKCFVVPIVRYLPEKKYRTKPKQSMLQQCLPLLEADIAEIKPKIIICMGKQVFDTLVTLTGENGKSFRARESEIMGAWFYEKRFNARMYYMPTMILTLNPEKHERFITDFAAVKKMLNSMEGLASLPFKTDYQVIRNSEELKQLVTFLKDNNHTELSIDCEWHGPHHVDGKLRTFQICWAPGEAATIRFMNDKLEYEFDVPYKEAGAILSEWLDQPQVKYIGHHISADLPWMHYWLGLEWYEKAKFDTEFALQACDESADLGLDALALKYTDLGKYDWDLIRWKKSNSKICEDGYGFIPDDILLPYAAADVDATLRAYLVIKDMLKKQDLVTYYNEILNPLVTDVFVAFCLTGLPIDTKKMDEMRDLYTWARDELQKDFQIAVAHEADTLLCRHLMKSLGVEDGVKLYDEIISLCGEGKSDEAGKLFRATVGPAKIAKLEPVFDHFLIAPTFNIRSKPQMQRWLFEVKGYTPIKSTANKDAGMPPVSWDKVLTYPPDKQKTFTPASDKGTLEVLAARNKDKVIDKLLELNAVGNICKAFLKSADIDEETGEVIKENGLHYWVASDGCVHLNNSTTETGRIRSWNPNVLNWPSWVHARLGAGMVRIIKERNAAGQLPEKFKKFADTKAKAFPTIRSVMMAKPGWCIVEADYQTAEMRGLAYISGDAELIKLIEEPDDCFALAKPECIPDSVDAEDCVVRIKFPEYIKYPEDRDKYLMTFTSGGAIKARFTEDQLLRDENGKIKSPKFDMHWGVLELARGQVREELDKKKDRGAGKVVNFSSSYGGQAASLQRKIEADTGNKPELDDVQAMLDAIERRQPRATQFFKELESVPTEKGYIRAASGRLRHCHTLSAGIKGLSFRTREGQLTALGRECRNFP